MMFDWSSKQTVRAHVRCAARRRPLRRDDLPEECDDDAQLDIEQPVLVAREGR